MRSALLIVVSRWATTIVVRLTITCSNAVWTIRSDAESKALVASSRSRTLGCFTMALAIATLCFCPPDTFGSPDGLSWQLTGTGKTDSVQIKRPLTYLKDDSRLMDRSSELFRLKDDASMAGRIASTC
ncbi:hypothetical protein IEQ34_013445 [Dendrobium chrysotoxum]|uniref:Secreted protein n=1 Tax=Dendrobium chrysotoxum TaxID=161865 RepID=A0AAV7G8X0_DENCH|nr:hypothetical protein IEQ34_013445 [Dendrobium chrysotoxum]